ncbi:hypothetical protein MPSEU_000031900 [Mayamaea pseudoterrestris]|nr:hypothetical protein MPSEU_000031900 [Mayamaea pseudoterrestris]
MDDPPSSHQSIGMHIDQAIDSFHSLSSTQLYTLIVGLIVLLTCYLLGSAPLLLPTGTSFENEHYAKRPHARKESDGPEPRWHIFRYVSLVMVALFSASVVEFGLHARAYMRDSGRLLQFLVGWSVCLCYFFGFFGVSFVYNSELGLEGDEDDQQQEAVQRKQEMNERNDCNGTEPIKPPRKSGIHPPAACAPICSDKSLPKPIKQAATVSHHHEYENMPNEDIAQLVLDNRMKDHELETRLDARRAVSVRRLVVQQKLQSLGRGDALAKLPYQNDLDYSRVHGANCEIVVGYVPIPVGMVGPLTLNDETVYIPMATTEGCLVASTNRGVKAITSCGGAHAQIVKDGITRAPCLRMKSAMEAASLKLWCEAPENFARLKQAFERTTSFGKLKSLQATVAGKNVYLRLVCFSGDAMGMNMVSKGSLAVIECLQAEFPQVELVALSGNMCTDKKAAATNWLEGRGKSVVVEAIISKDVVRNVLKTTAKAMVYTNLHKNLIGSAMAGVMGGFNAHASNIVTAIFLATGQDPAQNVESSNCITLMEETDEGDLWISCTMPSLEVGTVGGGTGLEAQAACLQAMGCKGAGVVPGDNAKKLASIVAAATMAGELSLLAALAANTLVQAHMQHNRKPVTSSSKV